MLEAPLEETELHWQNVNVLPKFHVHSSHLSMKDNSLGVGLIMPLPLKKQILALLLPVCSLGLEFTKHKGGESVV